MITAIGSETLRTIAISGPENQTKLLEGLGLQSLLITNGTTNLFQTANGLTGNKTHKNKRQQDEIGYIEEIIEEYSYEDDEAEEIKSFDVL